MRLRTAGFQVESVDTLGIKGSRNSELLQIAKDNEYLLITHDQDFLNPPFDDHYGIILVMIHPAKDEVAGAFLETYLRSCRLETLKKKLTILRE